MNSYYGKFWTEAYGRPELAYGLGRFMRMLDSDLSEMASSLDNAIGRSTACSYVTESSVLLEVPEDTLTGPGYRFDGTLEFNEEESFSSRPSGYFSIDVPENLTVRFIADDPVSPTFVLQAGIHFEQSGKVIDVFRDFEDLPFKKSLDDSVPPKKTVRIWLLSCLRNIHVVDRLYGRTVGAGFHDSPELANIYWDMLVSGCTLENLKKLLCYACDVDFVDVSGTVSKLYEEAGRKVAEIGGRIFSAPSSLSWAVSEGDEVSEGDFLVSNIFVRPCSDPILPEEFPVLHIDEGLCGIPGGVCVENSVVQAPALLGMGVFTNPSMDAIGDFFGTETPFLLSVKDGFEHVAYDRDDHPDRTITRVYDASFIKGPEQSVRQFCDKANALSLENGNGLMDMILAEASGGTFNPFEVIRKNVLSQGTVFIGAVFPDNAEHDPASCLSLAGRVFNTGFSTLSFFDTGTIVDYPQGSVYDTVDAFLVPDALEETATPPSDAVLT